MSLAGRELSPATRLAAFAVGLVVVLVAALLLGRATGDVAQAQPEGVAAPHGADQAHGAGQGHGADGAHGERDAAPAVNGTSLSAGGLRLDVPVTTIPPLTATPFTFRVLGADGPLTQFDVEHDRRMHLLIVSRDLSRLAHVHPELAPDGTWSKLLTLSPGSYRAVADFSTGGERHSLAVDLVTPGPLVVEPLPAPAATAQVDDLRVELARQGTQLSFTAYAADGSPVVPEPYLGARGHLSAFRVGDLAYAHVHPGGEDGATTTYDAELPGPGTYRLFLELKVDGTVRTASFTLEVAS